MPIYTSLVTTILLMIPFVLPLGLALDLYLPSVPSMASALDSSPVEIQLTMSVFLYCFGIGQLIIGPISDNFGRRHILLTSIGFFIVGSLICMRAESLSLMLSGRVLQAFGACGSQVIAFAMVRDQFDGKNATLIFTSLKGAMSIAPIAAPILGAFLQIMYGWQSSFLVLGLYGVVMLLLALFLLKETHSVNKSVNKSLQSHLGFISKYVKPYKTILSNVGFLYFCACAMATQAGMFGYFSLSPRYFIEHFGLSEAQFALLFSANACAFLITSVFAGRFIFRLGFRKSTLVGAFLLMLSGCAMIFGHYFYNHYYVLFLPNLIASASAAIMLGASASGALMPFKNNAGAASAMFGCLEFIGGGVIGSIAIMGNAISVLPLASSLLLMGAGILMVNLLFNQRLPTQEESLKSFST